MTLVAVTKTYGAEAIEPVIAAGQRVFGENRVQEAKAKWPPLRAAPCRDSNCISSARCSPTRRGTRWPCSTSSTRSTATGSRAALAEEMARRGGSRAFRPGQYRRRAAEGGRRARRGRAFLAACRDRLGLTISGLMCIPPVDEAPAPHFALLARSPANGLACLSMGMSADFEAAIRCGATHVRVGSAIFGPRD